MRKLLTFLIALSLFLALALAQSSPIAAFPPGVFQNRAAIDVPAATSSYVGPGDVLLGASSWWGFVVIPRAALQPEAVATVELQSFELFG